MNALIAGCGKKLYHVKGQGDAEDRDDEGDPIVVERTEGLQTSFQGNVQRGEAPMRSTTGRKRSRIFNRLFKCVRFESSYHDGYECLSESTKICGVFAVNKIESLTSRYYVNNRMLPRVE